MMYETETWPVKRIYIKKIYTEVMQILQQMCGVNKLHNIRNEITRDKKNIRIIIVNTKENVEMTKEKNDVNMEEQGCR